MPFTDQRDKRTGRTLAFGRMYIIARSRILTAVDEGRIKKGPLKMFGYETAMVMMVGKAQDDDRLAVAKRERMLSEEKRARRPARRAK